MSVYWYDESIIKKLREITGDARISILTPDTLFRFVANLKDDKVVFPLISLSRLGYTISRNTRTPASYQGLPMSKSGDNVDEIQFIPININYQLDIITRKRDDNDSLTDEILFYFINHPTLKVNIGKGANVSHVFSLFFNEDVTDNSDIESHMSRGEYFRTTLTFNVPDAKLWKTTSKKLYSIDPINFIATTDMNDESKDYINDKIMNNKENVNG